MSQVLDLDVVLPEEKILKLGGKEFDITIVPARISFNVYEFLPMITRLEKGDMTEDDYTKFLDIIFKVLNNADNSITKEWLDKNIDIKRFEQIVTFIFGAIFGTSKKNEETEEDFQESI